AASGALALAWPAAPLTPLWLSATLASLLGAAVVPLDAARLARLWQGLLLVALVLFALLAGRAFAF
ncbi:hypothetical protein MTR62_20205, partial [Novosphingobium sp. 1949]